MATKRLIDANALVIEELLVMDRDYINEFASGVRKVMNAIRRLPIVDAVEVVHGRWNEPYRLYVTCSNCGTGYVKYEFIERANYCPNCGAKMDGDGND